MSIHPLTVRGVRNLLKHDFNFTTEDNCKDERIIAIIDRNAAPFDPPVGHLVDIQLQGDDHVNLIIERDD